MKQKQRGPLQRWGISLLRWHCASPMPGRKWEPPKQRGAPDTEDERGKGAERPTLHCGSERASEMKKKALCERTGP